MTSSNNFTNLSDVPRPLSVPYAQPRNQLYPKPGNNQFMTSFQPQFPAKDFTHLNMVAFQRGESTHPLDHEFDKQYELYSGEGEIKRGFFKTEQEVLFAPRRDRQINYNNEWENTYDEREILSRVNANNLHNFERPKGTRMFVGPGIDPYFRRDKIDENLPYSYDSCPSYDWWRPQELDYEEYTGHTRPNFDITKQVKSGARPIFHVGENMYKQSPLRTPKFWNMPADMLFITGGAHKADYIRNTSDKNDARRESYGDVNYRGVAMNEVGSTLAGQGEQRSPHRNAVSVKDISGVVSDQRRGRSLFPKLNPSRVKREGIQTREGVVTGSINLPTLRVKREAMSETNRTLNREKDLRSLAQRTSADNLSKTHNNHTTTPLETRKQTTLFAPQTTISGNSGPTNRGALTTTTTRRIEYIENTHGGNIGAPINKTLRDTNSINLKPTHRYHTVIEGGKRSGSIGGAGTHVLTPIDPTAPLATRKQTTLYNPETTITGNYTKQRIQEINPQREARRPTASYTPIAGSDRASDPQYYSPSTLTHDARKYAHGYQFTPTRGNQFGNGESTTHNLREEWVDHRGLEERTTLNAGGLYQSSVNTTQAPNSTHTRESKKIEINPRCISVN